MEHNPAVGFFLSFFPLFFLGGGGGGSVEQCVWGGGGGWGWGRGHCCLSVFVVASVHARSQAFVCYVK